jgi:hypothetical protein
MVSKTAAKKVNNGELIVTRATINLSDFSLVRKVLIIAEIIIGNKAYKIIKYRKLGAKQNT